jgi:hypothetical protein
VGSRNLNIFNLTEPWSVRWGEPSEQQLGIFSALSKHSWKSGGKGRRTAVAVPVVALWRPVFLKSLNQNPGPYLQPLLTLPSLSSNWKILSASIGFSPLFHLGIQYCLPYQ